MLMVMDEFRCHNCKALLYKAQGRLEVEIICPKCRRINYPSRVEETLGLRGKDFQNKSIDHNCKSCLRLLFRSIGFGVVESKCKYCNTITAYDTQLIRKGKGKEGVT